MESTCCRCISICNFFRGKLIKTYAEGLEVVNGDIIAEQVDQRILEHAAVTVAARVSVSDLR